jgi:hypothetical protein
MASARFAGRWTVTTHRQGTQVSILTVTGPASLQETNQKGETNAVVVHAPPNGVSITYGRSTYSGELSADGNSIQGWKGPSLEGGSSLEFGGSEIYIGFFIQNV